MVCLTHMIQERFDEIAMSDLTYGELFAIMLYILNGNVILRSSVSQSGFTKQW